MSSIAKKLGITVGSLTIAMNHLVKKKYVERCRSEKDRRVVVVKLTEKGVSAYKHHEDYHRQMTEAVMDKLNETEMPVLMKMLDGLTEFFTGYSRQQ
ncbi:transcriptional regulator ZitR [Lachnospiraceae bacterium]|nr:transcriptional regulator ZitR [Lachnospiraceae bacterium]